jgi:LDH2 family malate/lactate/ureidoglycolate dehydrogenase
MKACIRKAAEHTIGIATVRNSNHFGFAGYYSMMALEKNMIEVSLTNSQPLMTPDVRTEMYPRHQSYFRGGTGGVASAG